MTVVFASGELESFTPSAGIFVTTSTARRDPNFARIAFRPINVTFVTANFASLTEGWLHFNVVIRNPGGALSDRSFVLLQDSATGQTVMHLDGDNGIFNLEYWNGASFTEIAPNLIIPNVRTTIDMHWKIANSGGVFEVFINGVRSSFFEGDTLRTNFTKIDRLILRPPSTFFNDIWTAYYTEVIVASQDTIGWHLATIAADGVGNSTTWVGDHTDINSTNIADGTFVSSGTAEEVEQFTVSNLSGVASGLNVEAVVVGARSRNTGAGPQNMQLGVRTDGQDFFGSTKSLGASFAPFFEIFEQNPDTSADWTPAEVDALEIGMKSKS